MNYKEYQQMEIDNILEKLAMSKFRNSFHLKKKEIEYIDNKGMDTIKKHAIDFVNKNLAPKIIKNDGKQTPTKNHPVFIAQHATATCCRGCLNKWHKIKNNKELSSEEKEYIVNVIMTYIKKDYLRTKKRP